jgi:hypothetical protein
MGEWQGGGNNIGTWYFDYDNMRSVLSGAEITSAAISVERMSAGYSTTPYYPRFYLHGLSTADWSKNHSTAPVMYAPPDYGTWGWVDWNTTFVAGERKWVKLPNEYIQWIRDGIVTGIGIYSPDGSPYMKFNNWAQIWVQYKK